MDETWDGGIREAQRSKLQALSAFWGYLKAAATLATPDWSSEVAQW